MGPPSRKYKPLSVCCLDNGACGGSGAPGFRHVPHPHSFNRHSLSCISRDSVCSVWPKDSYGVARWHGQHHTLKQLRKGEQWVWFWLGCFFTAIPSPGDSCSSAATAWPLLSTSELSMGFHVGLGGGVGWYHQALTLEDRSQIMWSRLVLRMRGIVVDLCGPGLLRGLLIFCMPNRLIRQTVWLKTAVSWEACSNTLAWTSSLPFP